jgi:hypothetical protein
MKPSSPQTSYSKTAGKFLLSDFSPLSSEPGAGELEPNQTK